MFNINQNDKIIGVFAGQERWSHRFHRKKLVLHMHNG